MLKGKGHRKGENERKEGGESRIFLPTTAAHRPEQQDSQQPGIQPPEPSLHEQRNKVCSRCTVE